MSRLIVLMGGAVFVCASLARALPVTFDGNIDQGGTDNYYVYELDGDDSTSDTSFGLGAPDPLVWNVKAVGLDSDPSWLYVGVDVVNGPFPTSGLSALWPVTAVRVALTDAADVYHFKLVISGSTMKLYDGTLAEVGAALWDAKALNDLELKLSVSLIPNLDLNTFTFWGWLDNVETPPDDGFLAQDVRVPEPATLVLLGLGSLGLLRRRRG